MFNIIACFSTILTLFRACLFWGTTRAQDLSITVDENAYIS